MSSWFVSIGRIAAIAPHLAAAQEGPVLFVGSSIFRKWTDVAEMMAPFEAEVAPYRFEDMRRIGDVRLRERAVNWKNVGDKYRIGQLVKGTVLKANPFGFFVELDKDIHGLAHISELSRKPVRDLSEIAKPGDTLTLPASNVDQRWQPSTASTPSRTPLATISRAPPGGSSSACWKTKRISPASSSRCSARPRATASSTAVCPSWPQACMAP